MGAVHRVRGGWRSGQWLEHKRALVDHGKSFGFPVGVGGGCMVDLYLKTRLWLWSGK